MLEPIKNFFRRRAIRKHCHAVPTGLVPLSEISSANVVIDVEETEWNILKEAILAWGRTAGVKVNIYFFDFRKLGKDELLLTSIQTTVARKDLNWIGMPAYEKVAALVEEPSDLFISLIDNGSFPIDYLSKCSRARFKIGRHAYPGHCYDMVITGGRDMELRSDSQEVFSKIVEFLEKISR